MRCFHHTDREAVAVCRTCGRGLCADCGEDIGRGRACRGDCAEWGRDYVGLLEESVRNYRIRAQQQKDLPKKAEATGNSGQPVALRNPGPTMQQRAELFRTVQASSPAPPARGPWRWHNWIWHLALGLVLVARALLAPDESLFILVLGLAFLGFGLYRLGVSRGRRWEMTKTSSGPRAV